MAKPKMLAAGEVREVVRGLHALYPDADCELRYENPLQLLVATILAAQSTDVRVNQVTETLFVKYPTAADFAAADPAVFEQDIRSTGFYRNKTRMVLGTARRLVEDYGGEVPDTMEDLVTLPGVARKTANVVLGTAFGIADGIVVDTHVRRLAYRMGLSDESDPERVERDLMAVVPREDWIWFGHAVILHGRQVCHARAPQCTTCPLADACPKRGAEEGRNPHARPARPRAVPDR
jgi:endonuclease-3